MDVLTLIHQFVLFLHLIAFAFALSAVLTEDLALLLTRRIDVARLAATARTLTGALVALWITGLALLVCDAGLDPRSWIESPKAAAKLLVVTALSVNGVLLHVVAFPKLGTGAAAGGAPALPIVLGAISTASWLCASFIGASRLIAPSMRLADFMALYAVLLVASIAVAMLFVRPRLGRLLSSER